MKSDREYEDFYCVLPLLNTDEGVREVPRQSIGRSAKSSISLEAIPDETRTRLYRVLQTSTECVPSLYTVEVTHRFLVDFHHTIVEHGLTWKHPHISVEDEQTIALEWWGHDKVLTLFVSSDKVEFLKTWGPHLWNEMDEGENPSSDQLIALWQWLNE
jgi:hypothetical protein